MSGRERVCERERVGACERGSVPLCACVCVCVCMCVCVCVCVCSTSSGDLDTPFARWSREQVCEWLQDQGLGLYVSLARQWISSRTDTHARTHTHTQTHARTHTQTQPHSHAD